MVDITTVYLARALGLNVEDLETGSYVYNTILSSHSFPTGAESPDQTFVPENVDSFPRLKRVSRSCDYMLSVRAVLLLIW